MSKNQENLAYDDSEILAASRRLVDRALQPQALADYILDRLDDDAGAADLLALRTAIDSRYPDFRKRFDKGERGDVEAELRIIDEAVNFHIGVAIGRRLR